MPLNNIFIWFAGLTLLNPGVWPLQLTTDYIKIAGKIIIVSPNFTKLLVLEKNV